jgi:hypothetical protein
VDVRDLIETKQVFRSFQATNLFEGADEARPEGAGVERGRGLDNRVPLGLLEQLLVPPYGIVSRVLRLLLLLEQLGVPRRLRVEPLCEADLPLDLLRVDLGRNGCVPLVHELGKQRRE